MKYFFKLKIYISFWKVDIMHLTEAIDDDKRTLALSLIDGGIPYTVFNPLLRVSTLD
jgi:hypothetical protein